MFVPIVPVCSFTIMSASTASRMLGPSLFLSVFLTGAYATFVLNERSVLYTNKVSQCVINTFFSAHFIIKSNHLLSKECLFQKNPVCSFTILSASTGASGLKKQVKVAASFLQERFLNATTLAQIKFDCSSAFCWEGNLFVYLFTIGMIL